MTAPSPTRSEDDTGGGGGSIARSRAVVWLAVVLAVGGGFSAWLASPGPAGTARPAVLLACHVLTPALAAALCLVTSRRSALRSDRVGWALLAASAATWGSGSVVFAWYQLVRGSAPYPSAADLLFLGYTIPALAGLFVFSRSVPHVVSRLHTVMDGLTMAAGLLLLSWELLFVEIFSVPMGDAGALAVTVAYPVLDTTIAAVVLSLAWRQARARFSLTLVGVGLLLVAVCDVFYVHGGLTGTLRVGEGFWQAGYTAGFLLVGVAALSFGSTAPVPEAVDSRDPDRRAAGGVEPGAAASVGSQVLVYAVLVAALVMAAAAPAEAWQQPLMTGLTVTTVVLALFREALVVADAAALRSDLEGVVKRRTDELKASRARLRAVTQTASDAIVVIDTSGRIEAWNGGAERLFACPADLAVGREMADFVPERFRDAHRAGVRRRAADPSGDLLPRVELEALRSDGAEVPVELSLSSWEVDGKHHFTGILRDISERRRSEERTARERVHMALVQKVAVAANASVDVESAFAATLEHVTSALGWPLGHAFLVDDEAPDEAPLISLGWHSDDLERYRELIDFSEGIPFTQEVGIVGRAVASRAPVWVRSSDAGVQLPRAPVALKVGLRSFHAFPVWWRDRLVAVLEFFSTGEVEPDREEFQLLDVIGTQLGRVVERDTAERRLSRMALQDSLTGLANRVVFNERLEEYVAGPEGAGRVTAVLLLDLDGFKEVNDSMGHAAGDELLVEVARRLAAVSRRDDTVARLGGDEFAVLTRGVRDTEDLRAHVGRLLDSLTQPVVLHGRRIRPGASVGVAIGTGDETAEVLLRNADLAMYEAKAAGKGRFAFFEPRMHDEVMERLELESGIGFALENRELRLMFLPVVSLTTGLVAGREAVLGWRHPTRGLVDPEPLLRQPRAAVVEARVRGWMLDRALSDAAAWRMEGEEVALHLRLPYRALTPDLVGRLDAFLGRQVFPAEDVVIQVRELHSSKGSPTQGLDELRRLGVGIIVEELGTGDETLSRLSHLPVHGLRIGDRLAAGLPDEPMARALAEAVLSMGLALEVGVVAAGVERQEQLDFLRARGCAAAQGPLLGSPVAYRDRARGRVLPALPGRLPRR